MNLGFIELVNNLQVSFETIILLLVTFGGLIFYARSVKVGLILHFFGFGLLFMWFWQAGYNFTPALIAFFISLVLLAFTLYAVVRTSKQGAII